MTNNDRVHLRVALPRDLHRLLRSVCHAHGDQTRLIVKGIKWAVKEEIEKQRILEEHGYAVNRDPYP